MTEPARSNLHALAERVREQTRTRDGRILDDTRRVMDDARRFWDAHPEIVIRARRLRNLHELVGDAHVRQLRPEGDYLGGLYGLMALFVRRVSELYPPPADAEADVVRWTEQLERAAQVRRWASEPRDQDGPPRS